MLKLSLPRGAAIAAAFALSVSMLLPAGRADAAPVSTCSIFNFTTSTACIPFVPGAPDGEGGGNVDALAMNAFGDNGAFGSKIWIQLAELKEPGTVSNPSLFSITYDNPAKPKSGKWTLTSPLTWGNGLYAFAVKGATDNAVYLMDKNSTEGNWTVNDLLNPGKQIPDLSNMRLFGTVALTPTQTGVIPLPAAAWLLLGGLGYLGVVARRRKASVA